MSSERVLRAELLGVTVAATWAAVVRVGWAFLAATHRVDAAARPHVLDARLTSGR